MGRLENPNRNLVPDYNSNMDTVLPTTISATQASVSVLLILAYGYYARKKEWISEQGEKNISSLGTNLFLPALLFSEIGPLASAQNLKHCSSLSFLPLPLRHPPTHLVFF